MNKLNTSNNPSWRPAGLLVAAALTLGLAACGERVDTPPSEPGNPAVGQAIDGAGQRTEQAGSTVREDASRMAENVERKIDDAAITASVNASLAKDPDLSAVKIDVDTKGGVVTLSGPAPTAAAKDRATSLAQAVDGVAGVNNNLEVRAG